MRNFVAWTLLGLATGTLACERDVNYPPTARAGADQVVAAGAQVYLDGSASRDPDGDTGKLSYQWSLIEAPKDSSATVDISDQAHLAMVNTDLPGDYIISLVVTDGLNLDSTPDVVVIHAMRVSDLPVAVLEGGHAAGLGEELTLDGTRSTPEGEIVEYRFETVLRPDGSEADVSSVGPRGSIVPDQLGTWVVGLTVNDGNLDSARADLVVPIGASTNWAPEAVCPSDHQVLVGDDVVLDGTDSVDPEGSALGYRWALEIPDGSAAELDNDRGDAPTFHADVEGTFVATLWVNDGLLTSEPCSTTIRATDGLDVPPECPVVDNVTAYVGETATLDASGASDADGDPLTWQWTLVSAPSGSSAVIEDATEPVASLVPDVDGGYTVRFEVCDDSGDCCSDTFLVTGVLVHNTAPECRLEGDSAGEVGSTVSLDASSSYDPEGDAMTYAWSWTRRPSGSSASLTSSSGVTSSFTPDVPGTYGVQLQVCDDSGECCDTATTFNISSPNTCPNADAGDNASVDAGEAATLNGAGSYDSDGDPLTYTWYVVSRPAGSTATVASATSATTTFTPDEVGTYVIQLTVNDGECSDTDTVVVRAVEANHAPVCDAGASSSVSVGEAATLDGTGTSDADGDALTYAWSILSRPTGSGASISGSSSVTASITPDEVGTYTIQLSVSDGTESCTDTVVVTGENDAPVCNAGSDQSVDVGETVTLDGTGTSDPNGDSLTYTWSFTSTPSGSGVALSGSSTTRPSFTPDVEGTYVVRIVASDGTDTCRDTVTITAVNSPPECDAGSNQSVHVGTTTRLDGSGTTDPNGDALTYSWTFSLRPTGSSASLSGSTTVTPSFVSDLVGTYSITLAASDGTDSCRDVVSVTASNNTPTCSAGSDQTVSSGDVVRLSASGSSDSDGDSLTYAWSILSAPSGSTAALSSTTSVSPRITPVVTGDYVIEVEVSDSWDSCSDTMTITVENQAPVCDAGSDQTVDAGDTVTLDGRSTSDPDGDSLTYSWAFTSRPAGSSAALSSSTSTRPTFVTDEPGTYTVRITASDGTDTCTDTVTVTAENAAPVCNAGSDQSVDVGASVTLDGSATSDADGDALTYSWSFVSRPTGSSATLSSSTGTAPRFTADQAGTYVVEISATDGWDSCTDRVSVTTNNRAPSCDAGGDLTGLVGETITLDGTGSSDEDGDALSYSWSITSAPTGSTASLTSSSSSVARLVPDTSGTWRIRMSVSDGLDSCSDTVVVTIENQAPTCEAGTATTVETGETVTLDGSGTSDPDGDSLTFSWTVTSSPSGATAVPADSSAQTTTITPDVAGSWVVRISATDGTDSCSDTVRITVNEPNNPPVCDAGTDQVIYEGDSADLDGSGTTDADGDALSYTWSVVLAPSGSSARPVDASAQTTTITPDVVGTYTVRIEADDGEDTCSDTVRIVVRAAPANNAPVCDAGSDQTIVLGESADLDGSGTTDADGDSLTFLWTVVSAPSGSSAAPASSTAQTTTFTPDVAGTYRVAISADDGTDACSDEIVVTVEADNNAPICDAGGDQGVLTGDSLALDGSDSSDPDGDSLTWSWTLRTKPTGSTATLSGSTSSIAAITPDVDGTYSIRMTVSDGTDSCTDTITVTASSDNQPPECDAGGDHTVAIGTATTLDGRGSSDPEGATLSYYWLLVSKPAGSTARVSGSTVSRARITPDLAGTYLIEMRVSDGELVCTEVVTVTAVNRAPTCDLVADASVAVGDVAALDASGSTDADGDALSYTWTVITYPSGSTAVVDDDTADVTFIEVDRAGSYTVQVEVSDGIDSCSETATILATDGNSAPLCDAGGDLSVELGESASFDGTGSSDPDGDPISYTWTVTSAPSGSTASLADDDTSVATLDADVAGTYVVELEVSDGLDTCTDTASLTVAAANTAPVCDAGGAISGLVGETSFFDGSGSSDADGDPLSFTWTLLSAPSGSSAVLGETSSEISEIVPDLEGTYTVRLVVSDGEETCSDTATLTASPDNNAPVCDAGGDQSISLGETATLDGSATDDPDGDPLSFTWTLDSAPSGSAATIRSASSSVATIRPDVEGDYVITLDVSDGDLSCSETITISTANDAPVCDLVADTTVSMGESATLDASGSSDPNGDSLSFSWAVLSRPTGSTATVDDATADVTFLTPDEPGSYRVRVTVSDGSLTCTSTATITAENTAPTCNAGTDQTVRLGDAATLSASGSADADGDALTYSWTVSSAPSGSTASPASPSSVSTAFTPDVEGAYVLQVEVSDGYDSCTDTVSVTAEYTNDPPVADAGDDQSQCSGDLVTLDGSGSIDPDGDSLSYTWTFSSVPSGSAITDADLSDTTDEAPTFTPDLAGDYLLELTVSDGEETDTDTVTVSLDWDDAVLVLHFDDGSGTTVVDDGPNGLDGTTVGSPSWGGGVFFGALDFDGTNDYVNIPHDSDLDLVDDWTVEWWMVTHNTSTSYQAIFIKGNYNYALYRYGSSFYFWGRYAGSGSYASLSTTSSTLGDGQWHHYALTMGSGSLKLYEDGALLTTASASRELSPNGSPLYLGRYYGGSYYYLDGSMDEFIIRQRALTATEVRDRYEESTQFCTGDQDTDAPSATITDPSSGTSSDTSIVRIEGTASDESAITSITVNGVEAAATTTNYGTWVAYVELSEGRNTIVVSTEDIAGNTNTNADSITVTYSEPSCGDENFILLAMDEDSGTTTADWSVNGLDANLVGAQRTAGVYGNGLQFDGSSDYAYVADDDALDLTSDYSFDFWYLRDGSTSSWETVMIKGTVGWGNYSVWAYNNWIGYGVSTTSGTTAYAYAPGFNDGDWHHVVVVNEGSTIRLYVDGNLEDSASVSFTPSTTSDRLYIGAYSGAWYHFEGSLDQIRGWDSALSASEVRALYTEGEVCQTLDNLTDDYCDATASRQYSAAFPATRVCDDSVVEEVDSDYTMWLLPNGVTGYVTVDLGEPVGVSQVRWANTKNRNYEDRATSDWRILASSTGDFSGEEVEIGSGSTTLEDPILYHYVTASSAVTAQYIRFYVDDYYGYGGGVNEIDVYGVR